MKRILILFLLLFAKQLFSQDVEFSQYYANPLYLNPAFAGSDDYTRIALNYRTISPSSFGDYSTYSASVDKYFDGLSGGVGFQIFNDRQAQGAINDLSFNLMYSYHAQLKKKWSINTGFRLGYNIKSLNASNLVFGDEIDVVSGNVGISSDNGVYQKSMYFDFSFGMLTWYENYFMGFTIDHLTKPIISLGSDDPGTIERKYTVHGGMELPFFNSIYKKSMTISPNVILQMQGASSKLNLGIYLNKNYLTTGAWLKTNTRFNLSGCVLMLGYITEYSTFAYSYDVPFYLGGLSGIISGGHEVTFLYKFMYKTKRKKIKAIKCPKI